MKLPVVATVFLCALGIVTTSPGSEASSSPWAQLALQDLEAIHTLIQDDHPGTLDDKNPDFRKWLEEGYAAAREQAKGVSSFEGYEFTIYGYGYGFRDPSIHVSFTVRKEAYRWPGFLTTVQNGQFVARVDRSIKNQPSVPNDGDVLVSCDGQTPDELLAKKVYPVFGKANGEAARTWSATRLFVDGRNPFTTRPENCVFKSGDKTKALQLVWKKIDRNVLFSLTSKAMLPPEQKMGIREFKKDYFWVSLPSFSDLGSNAEASRLLAKIPSLRKAKVVVIDVRGNSGGDFQWASQLLETLYGTDYLEEKSPSPGIYDWKVSKKNLERHQEFLSAIGDHLGETTQIYLALKSNLDGFAKALDSHEPFYREDTTANRVKRSQPSLNKSKVYFLTDGACVGACLCFAGRLLETKQAIQIGLPTDADWPYVASREEVLPSGIAAVSVATKMVRDRGRDAVPFVPQYRWDKDIRDTRALEKWVVQLSAQDKR